MEATHNALPEIKLFDMQLTEDQKSVVTNATV